jgi:ABC-type sugar transport system substrate-binding protein
MRGLKPLPALALAAAVAGACGSIGSGQTSAGPKHVSVSFVYAGTTINAMEEMAMGARAAAEQSPGVDFTEAAPPGVDPGGAAEARLFQAAIKASRDGVAYETVVPDALVQPLEQAHTAGVPLVAVDAAPPPSSNVDTFVGNSNFEVGQQLARQMLEQIPAGATGRVVVGNSFPGFGVLDQRVTGMLQVIRQERPGVQVIGPFETKRTPEANAAAWREEVRQYPNALAYLAPSDLDAVSLAQIERQTGRHLLVGGCDLEAVALQAVKDGLVYALASPEHWLKGYIAIRLLIQHAQLGKSLPEGWWNPGALVVDQSNVDSVIARQKDEASRTRWFMPAANRQFANQGRYVLPLSAAI